MPVDSFFDSNVLLYLNSPEDQKSETAVKLIRSGGCISVQVLNEFVSVCRRKSTLSWAEIRSSVEEFKTLLTVLPVTSDDHGKALALAERHKLPFYDAVIAASALNAGCDHLWTEDLHHGLVLEGRLTIQNPFRAP